MKLCMISRVFPPKIGGTGSLLEMLSENLVKKGFEVHVITQKPRNAPKHEELNGVKIHRTRVLSEENEFSFANLTVGSLAMASKIISLKKCDLFHAHDISVAGFSAWFSKKLIRNKPFLLKYGGDLVFEYLSLKNFKKWNPKKGLEETLKFNKGFAGFLHKLQQWYFKDYDFILPDSLYGSNFLTEKLNVSKEKIKVIRNGVDTEFFKPINENEARKKVFLPEDKLIVFSASRLVKWKGIDVLINAFSLVSKKIPDSLLVIAGNGPEENNLKLLTKKLALEKKVLFAGNIERQVMPYYLNAADVFVLPSYFDTMPNALLEAMSCGKACVVSNIAGIMEVAENSSLSVNVGNHKELSEALLRFLSSDSLRHSFGRKARKTIEENFSLKKTIREYFNFYSKFKK